MADRETCTICLDHLFQSEQSIITKLQPCAHYYHSECIDAWKERSNTCPTCRNDYDIIEMVDMNDVVKSSIMATKMTEIPLNHEEFFFENVDQVASLEEEDRTQRRINMLIASSNSCVLCDSYNGNVTSCNTCASSFHHRCIGLGSLSFWLCPMCDTEQIISERSSRFRRSRNSAITNRVYNSYRHLILQDTGAVVTENIVKRETMTPEEQHAWDTLEIATKERENNECKMYVDINIGQSNPAEPPKKLKQPSRRGRRLKQVNNQLNTFTIPTTSAPSLVNSILDQFKQKRQHTATTVRTRSNSSPSGSPFSKPSPSSPSQPLSPLLLPVGSTVVSPSFCPLSPTDSETSRSNRSVWKMDLVSSKTELSLDQKSILQGIVRKKLRPLYKNGDINFDQYTNINKRVSHILYDHFINSQDLNTDFEAIADHHLSQEIIGL